MVIFKPWFWFKKKIFVFFASDGFLVNDSILVKAFVVADNDMVKKDEDIWLLVDLFLIIFQYY